MCEELRNFISTYAKENQISKEIVEKIFEQSVKIAASRYYPEEIANSLHYDEQTGKFVDSNNNVVDIKGKFGVGGIKLLKDNFLHEMKEFFIDKELMNLQESRSKLIIGKVIGKDKKRVFLSYKTLELIMPKEEQMIGEEYRIGDIYKVVVVKTERVKDGYEVIVSRRNDNLLFEMLMLEIPELRDNRVSVYSFVREPGYRSKIVVKANVPNIDLIGVCMGLRNARISNVSRELNGERIDIIEWKDDIKELIRAALKPAQVSNIILIECEKKAIIETPEKDIGVCLGKSGQNIRLASRLCGWYLEIRKDGYGG